MNKGETRPIEILLVEDSPSDALLLQESLAEAVLGGFDFTHVECWADAAQCLREKEFDVLLLDLSLPDSTGRETFLRARAEAPHLPIVVLTGGGNEALGLEAVRHGIQDYLIKGEGHGRQTARAIRYAIERHHAEAMLHESEARFRLVLEHSNDAIFWADAETGILLRCNRKAEELTERTRDELIGMHQAQLHPPDRDYREMFRQAAALPSAENIEAEVLSRTGKRTPVLVNCSVVTFGQKKIIQGNFRDVTERRQAEKALQRARDQLEIRVQERTAELRQANEQLQREIEVRRQTERELTETEFRYRMVADFTHGWEYWETPECALRYCSPSCERITGYSAREFMADPSLLQQIVHPEDADIWRQHQLEARTRAATGLVEFRVRQKDGGVRWVEHACQMVLGEDGSFLGIRASNRDVTERRAAEAETQQLREELAHVTRVTTAGQLAASLAHELNQPLTAIRCNAQTAQQLLAATPPDVAEVRETLDDIASDSERAGEVIRRLRALFNKTGHQRTVLELNEIIEETLSLLRSEFVLKETSTRLHLEPALPNVVGDRVALQQAVLNLIVNALEAMVEVPPASRILHISTSQESPTMIRASFRDFGPGIPQPQLSRLFEPFFTTKANGMGMGLAIAQSIVEAHSGGLQAVNNPDRGATFHLTLPIHHPGKP